MTNDNLQIQERIGVFILQELEYNGIEILVYIFMGAAGKVWPIW